MTSSPQTIAQKSNNQQQALDIDAIRLSFFGATGTVTGSKYLVEFDGKQVLVDCGLFQGFKQLRLRNWALPPFDAKLIDTVVLTHSHIDHSGYLPLLVKNGFNGDVICSHGTAELCQILLPDSAHLQEEEANFANRHSFSKHKPALPLYTVEDARAALRLLRPVNFTEKTVLSEKMSVQFNRNGHILGSSSLSFEIDGEKLVFSGDIGRLHDSIMRPPERLSEATYLVVESTYGNRLHEKTDPAKMLADVVNRTIKRGGVVVIPAFAVGRAQLIITHLYRLRIAHKIPNVPIYLNSPMAVDATRLFARHRDEHLLSHDEYQALFQSVNIVNTPEESRDLNSIDKPMIIVSASGMATGGRVLHHIKRFAPEAKNTILFAGFQAAGTRGAKMVDGEAEIKMFGEYVPIRAEIQNLDGLSSHADYDEILDWLSAIKCAPRRTFITHGEPASADAMRLHIEQKLHWPCEVPDYLETTVLN